MALHRNYRREFAHPGRLYGGAIVSPVIRSTLRFLGRFTGDSPMDKAGGVPVGYAVTGIALPRSSGALGAGTAGATQASAELVSAAVMDAASAGQSTAVGHVTSGRLLAALAAGSCSLAAALTTVARPPAAEWLELVSGFCPTLALSSPISLESWTR